MTRPRPPAVEIVDAPMRRDERSERGDVMAFKCMYNFMSTLMRVSQPSTIIRCI